ncbi:MAG: NUDIX hydrolase, partial [Actinomyces sp.]|nr:NUDIX hydrolase [Actinomyces sp.]
TLALSEQPIVREYMGHPGAVVIVALRGDEGNEEILLERQYRHPVRAKLWEVPAGLLDIPGEDPLIGAQRELAEEADLTAKHWDVLLDIFNSPGCSSESIRIFLARGLAPTGQTFDREDEEADFEYQWVSLDEAVTAALDGRLHNASTVSAVLATDAARRRGWQLRSLSSQWLR